MTIEATFFFSILFANFSICSKFLLIWFKFGVAIKRISQLK